MDNGIGATLRDARNRRKLGLEEVEEATKIRLRFLRAMENEEWDALPGGAYSRAFLRTYASYLGLDGERIAEDYRRTAEHSALDGHGRSEPPRARLRSHWPSGRPQVPGRLVAVLVSALLIGVVVAIGLSGGGEGGKPGRHAGSGKAAKRAQSVAKPGVALRLAASGEVWVCLIDSGGKRLINGEILEPGAKAGPFRAKGFTAAFGNGDFQLTIDGEAAKTPPSSSPVGYEIDAKGNLTPLEEGERPECA